ncbi:MAG: ribosome silencing factor [Nitrospirota bacterium]|nr:ribosome silencing factor [Nitrospirota bacterium]
MAKAMFDKKATDVLVLQVAPLTSVADYLVIGSADSDRQASAIADHINGILALAGSRARSIEGARNSQWVLMDYGDVIAHIFRQDVRGHYALERLWADAKRIPVSDEPPTVETVAAPEPVKKPKKAPEKKASAKKASTKKPPAKKAPAKKAPAKKKA